MNPVPWLPEAGDGEACANLCSQLCRAADHSRAPLRHAAIPEEMACNSWMVRLEVRNEAGERMDQHDLELEIYGKGEDPSLQLAWLSQPQLPMLWQGRHPVWIDATSGLKTERPQGGETIETLARRLRAELTIGL